MFVPSTKLEKIKQENCTRDGNVSKYIKRRARMLKTKVTVI